MAKPSAGGPRLRTLRRSPAHYHLQPGPITGTSSPVGTSQRSDPTVAGRAVCSRAVLGRLPIRSVESTSPISHLGGLSLTALRIRCVNAVDIQTFLNCMGSPPWISAKSVTGIISCGILCLSTRLGISPPRSTWPWTRKGQVTSPMGALQGILEQAAADLAFDLEFLTPIAVSQFPWATSMLQDWAQTAELTFQAAHGILECRTDRQGLVFLVVAVLVHHLLWGIPSRALSGVGPAQTDVWCQRDGSLGSFQMTRRYHWYQEAFWCSRPWISLISPASKTGDSGDPLASKSQKNFRAASLRLNLWKKTSLKSAQPKLHLHLFSKNFKARVRGRTAMQ